MEEIKKEIKIFTATNENKNTTKPMGFTEPPVLSRRFIAIQAYLKKQEKHQVNNLALNLEKLEKEQRTPKLVEGSSVQWLSPVSLCNTMDCSMPGFPVHHQLLEPTQTHACHIGDGDIEGKKLSKSEQANEKEMKEIIAKICKTKAGSLKR